MCEREFDIVTIDNRRHLVLAGQNSESLKIPVSLLEIPDGARKLGYVITQKCVEACDTGGCLKPVVYVQTLHMNNLALVTGAVFGCASDMCGLE